MLNDGNRRNTYGSETAPWRNSTTDTICLGIPNNKYKGGGELHLKENMQYMNKNDRTQKQTGRSQLAATMANATQTDIPTYTNSNRYKYTYTYTYTYT